MRDESFTAIDRDSYEPAYAQLVGWTTDAVPGVELCRRLVAEVKDSV